MTIQEISIISSKTIYWSQYSLNQAKIQNKNVESWKSETGWSNIASLKLGASQNIMLSECCMTTLSFLWNVPCSAHWGEGGRVRRHVCRVHIFNDLVTLVIRGSVYHNCNKFIWRKVAIFIADISVFISCIVS